MPTPLGDTIPHNIHLNTTLQNQSVLPVHRSPQDIQRQQLRRIDQGLHQPPPSLEENAELEPSRVYESNTRLKRTAARLSTSSVAEDRQHLLCDDLSDAESDAENPLMGRKARSSKSHERDQAISTASEGQNGHANAHANGNMNSHMEMRRKNPSLDSPTSASQTAHLMSRENFTLDDEPPPTPLVPHNNTGFFDLPKQDRRNFLLLVLLYFLQGIPMGLATGSVPFLLKKYLSYGQIGVFSLAAYPYSLKLLWSPIVDAVWNPRFGRRKSWIMPIQICSGLGMIYLGGRIKEMMLAAGASDGSGVWTFTWWWFFLVFLCATQDIAVDGEGHTLSVVSHAWLTWCIRMGLDSNITPKPVLRFNRSNRWPDRRPFHVLYCLPSVQRPRLRQSIFPLHPNARRCNDTGRLSHILGLGIPSSNPRPGFAETGGED